MLRLLLVRNIASHSVHVSHSSHARLLLWHSVLFSCSYSLCLCSGLLSMCSHVLCYVFCVLLFAVFSSLCFMAHTESTRHIHLTASLYTLVFATPSFYLLHSFSSSSAHSVYTLGLFKRLFNRNCFNHLAPLYHSHISTLLTERLSSCSPFHSSSVHPTLSTPFPFP